MSINIKTGVVDKTCLFCYYCITYDFRQTENDVTLQQIIATCNKHLPQEVIGSIIWENVISATEIFCKDCQNLAIQLVTLNADLDRILKEIEVLGSHFSNRIVSGKRNYELSTASNIILHNDSPENSNGENCTDISMDNSPNTTEIDGDFGNSKTQASQIIYNTHTDLQNNSKSYYKDATAKSSRENTYVNESSLKNTNNSKRTAKQKRPQKVKNVDTTTVSTEKMPPTIVTGSDLQHHLDNDIASGYQCEKCQKRFARLSILQNHDCSKPTIECEVCNKSFSGAGVLKLHMRCHTGEKPFKCDICGKSFSVRCHLTTHLKVHSKEKPFKCDICDKSFRDENYLKKHIKMHKKGESKYKCDICSKSLGTFNSLKQHIMYHKEEMPHKCETCGKGYTSEVRLRAHKRRSHLEVKPFKCEQCGKGFVHNCELMRHLETHSAEKSFLCEECGKSFRTSSYLAIHTLTHTEKGPFVCEVCGKKSVSSVRLKAHIDLCHSEKTIKCLNCNIVFKNKRDLFKHQESIDCEIGPTFVCNQCDKSFNSKLSRRRHILVEHFNENERPKYCCDACPEIFYMSTDLRAHKKRNRCNLFGISKVNKGVSCETCKNYFENEENLQKHQQKRPKVMRCNFCPELLRTDCEYNTHRQKLHPNGESFYKCKICSVPCGSRKHLRDHMKSGHYNQSFDKEDSDIEDSVPSSSSMETRSSTERENMELESESESSSAGEDEGDNAIEKEGKWNAENQIGDSEDEKIEIKIEDVVSETEEDDYILGT